MHSRRIVSLTALMTFAALAVSGTVLFAVPQGRVANWAVWAAIASANRVTPQQVYDVITPARSRATIRGGEGVTPSGSRQT